MSRKGIKTVNLPVALVDLVDVIVRDKRFTSLSRDEFVRQAVGILVLAIMDTQLGRAPFESVKRPVTELLNQLDGRKRT